MDREAALEFLTRLADGLSDMFGQRCECVIHDMHNFDQSIVHISHGHVTGRDIGNEFNILGTKDVDKFFSGTDLVNCKGITRDGRSLKSSTFHFEGDGYHFAFGVNFDYTHYAFAESILRDLTQVGEDIDDAIKESNGPEERLDGLLTEGMKTIGKPLAMMSREDKVSLARFLKEKGAFTLQRSVPYLADKLQVSRYTLYNYLKKAEPE
jgi:predicted transcriptional regulator YheO